MNDGVLANIQYPAGTPAPRAIHGHFEDGINNPQLVAIIAVVHLELPRARSATEALSLISASSSLTIPHLPRNNGT